MIFFNKKKKISPGVTVIPPHCSTTVVTSRQNSKDCNYIIYIKSIIMCNLFYYYMCAYHFVISSIPGKSFHFPFP